jgi:hypothetical protein
MPKLAPNHRTAARLAFHLAAEPPATVGKLLKQLGNECYRYARETGCDHDEATAFVVAFIDEVVRAWKAEADAANSRRS